MPRHSSIPLTWTSPGTPSDGTHIASLGSYCDSIVKLTDKYPNLKYPDYKKYNASSKKVHDTRTAAIRFKPNDEALVTPFSTLDGLHDYLQSQARLPEEGPTRELFLVEGTNPNVVSILGSALQIDPNVFMRHQRTGLWESDHRAGCTPSLPSLKNPAKGFVLDYRELSYFIDSVDGYPLRAANNERNIRVTRLSGKYERVGAVHRKASFWAQELGEGSWKAILILDEPVGEILLGPKKDCRCQYYSYEPFQGGYADFIAYPNIEQALRTHGPPRKSMFDDLCYYFSNHSDELAITEHPDSSMLFLKKIVASHYMMLYTYTQGILDHLTWFLGNQKNYAKVDVNDWIAGLWGDLHTFNRRCQYDLGDISSIVAGLNLDMKSNDPTAQDFLTLREEFRKLTAKADAISASCNALANVEGIKQSLFEARNVKRLTIFGMIFLPLSFTSSLFSMAPDYLPGAHKFWTYFAVAIPIILAISAAPTLMDWLRAFQEQLTRHNIRLDIWSVESSYGGSQDSFQMKQFDTRDPHHEKFWMKDTFI